jgi:hypothetical protein
MTIEEINNFEKTQAQLESLHVEISALTKKSSNDALNKFKLKFVNKILEDANILLGGKYVPFDGFDKFDENDLPTNSDVTMMLGQYLNCMEKLRSDNLQNRHGYWYWMAEKSETTIRTLPPNKIIHK